MFAEAEMARTQKNKATAKHLGVLKAKLSKLRAEVNGIGTKVCCGHHSMSLVTCWAACDGAFLCRALEANQETAST